LINVLICISLKLISKEKNSEYNILTLLRTHKYDEDTKCAVKEKYPFTHAANGTLDSIIIEERLV